MESRPKVTIGLPVYNGASTIREALDSLLAQSFTDFELIVSDNCSTDSTYQLLKEYAARDPRIVVSRNETNLGAVANFKLVLERARGEYFMWAAADDRWLPSFIAVLLKELENHPEAGVAMCAIERVLEDGGRLDTVRFQGAQNPSGLSHYQILWGLLSPRKYNLYIYGLYRTEILKRAMNVFPRVLGGDRLFLCQIALATRFRYVDEVLYSRTHNREHEKAYREEFQRRWVPTRQVLALGAVILGSRVVPLRRKWVVAPALLRYFLLTFGKAYSSQNTWKLLKRFLEGDPIRYRKVARVALPALALAALSVAAAAGLWGAAAAAGLLALECMAGLFLFLWWRLRKKLLVLLKESSRMQRHVETLLPLRQELRYLSDLAFDGRSMPPLEKGNPLAKHAREHYERQRKRIAFARAVEGSRIRELFLAEIFPDIDQVSLPVGAINELSGHPNKVDLLYVCAVAKLRGARSIFEFGTYQGRTTYHLTFASEEARVTTLNLPPEADSRYGPYLGRYFLGTEREKRITQLHADSRQFDARPYRQQFDFIFVDGDHSYELVQNDTLKAFEMLKPGGAIMWHDYGPKSEQLVQFFSVFTRERPLFRIKRTCLLLHVDGLDPLSFSPHPLPPSLEREFLGSDPFFFEELYHA